MQKLSFSRDICTLSGSVPPALIQRPILASSFSANLKHLVSNCIPESSQISITVALFEWSIPPPFKIPVIDLFSLISWVSSHSSISVSSLFSPFLSLKTFLSTSISDDIVPGASPLAIPEILLRASLRVSLSTRWILIKKIHNH